MRFAVDPQPTLGSTPILEVDLNCQCRDEIVPILRALRHIYGEPELRHDLLQRVGHDVNRRTSRRRGRKGMDYWQVIVLAAVRLGCNLNFDKLQDLAEQHRALRQIMGIGDWDRHVRFDWRRIRDNIDWLRPPTLQKINELLVAAGHRLAPQAPESVRGDSFVVETNIHYPTDSSLIGDGLRKKRLKILVGSSVPVSDAVLEVNESMPVQVLTHKGKWLAAKLTRHGCPGDLPFSTVFLESEEPIKGGTSGGPVTDNAGRLVGVISWTNEVPKGPATGMIPVAHLALPRWLWSRIAAAQ